MRFTTIIVGAWLIGVTSAALVGCADCHTVKLLGTVAFDYPASQIVTSPNGEYVVVMSFRRDDPTHGSWTATLINTKSRKKICSHVFRPNQYVEIESISSDGASSNIAVSSPRSNDGLIWHRVNTATWTSVLDCPNTAVTKSIHRIGNIVTSSPDMSKLLVRREHGYNTPQTYCLVDANTGRLLVNLQPAIQENGEPSQFSRDNRFIMSPSVIWDAASGKVKHNFGQGLINYMSPYGTFVVRDVKGLSLYETSHCSLMYSVTTNLDARMCCVSDDDRWLAATGQQGIVQIWDTKSKDLACTLKVAPACVGYNQRHIVTILEIAEVGAVEAV